VLNPDLSKAAPGERRALESALSALIASMRETTPRETTRGVNFDDSAARRLAAGLMAVAKAMVPFMGAGGRNVLDAWWFPDNDAERWAKEWLGEGLVAAGLMVSKGAGRLESESNRGEDPKVTKDRYVESVQDFAGNLRFRGGGPAAPWQAVRMGVEVFLCAVRADNISDKSEKKRLRVPTNPDVARLARRIKDCRNKDRSKSDVALDFTEGDEKKATNLLRQLRRYPHLLT
jgi:hypothetical protein